MPKIHHLSIREILFAVGVGVGTAVLLSAVMLPLFKAGISPFPKPVGLAFAQTFLGKVPFLVGLLFHLVYVTFWGIVFVFLFRDRLTFVNVLFLGLLLWIIQLVVFFPMVGWGFFGLAISPKLIIASLLAHVLFVVFLWGLCQLVFKRGVI